MYHFGVIDAVPKKRGPKTDVLEALLKRVDGLEAQLKEKKEQPTTPTTESTPLAAAAAAAASTPARSAGPQGDDESGEKQTAAEFTDPKAQPTHASAELSHAAESSELAVYTPSSNRCARPIPNLRPREYYIVRFARQQLIVYAVLLLQLPSSPMFCSINISPDFTPNLSTFLMSRLFANGFSSINCQTTWCMPYMP